MNPAFQFPGSTPCEAVHKAWNERILCPSACDLRHAVQDDLCDLRHLVNHDEGEHDESCQRKEVKWSQAVAFICEAAGQGRSPISTSSNGTQISGRHVDVLWRLTLRGGGPANARLTLRSQARRAQAGASPGGRPGRLSAVGRAAYRRWAGAPLGGGPGHLSAMGRGACPGCGPGHLSAVGRGACPRWVDRSE